MKDILFELLAAVLVVCIPIVARHAGSFLKKAAEKATADIDDTRLKSHIAEITDAVVKAVSSTSQTYVDSLKAAGKFTKQAQEEALQKSLATAIGILTPAATQFIEQTYGDVKSYLLLLVEAEVRKQKLEQAEGIPLAIEATAPDTAAIAASAAAATAATIAQTAIAQQRPVEEPPAADPEA